tara:strand:- start:6 stop:359 length:354 start_codon:yes stop_codon:yes gene_type:complete
MNNKNNLKQIKTININAKEWFDKINGNSYFSGYVIVNRHMKSENVFLMRFQYGYGDQYIYEAIKMISKYYNLEKIYSPTQYFRDNNINLNYKIKENCNKKELLNIGWTKWKYNEFVK